jgi:ABC-type Fe3+-siderophore transport system permease subunit
MKSTLIKCGRSLLEAIIIAALVGGPIFIYLWNMKP